MKKLALIVILAAIFATAGFYLLSNSSPSRSSEFVEIKSELPPLACDMGASQSCTVKFNDQEVKFSLFPRPIYVMQPITMRISGLQGLNLKQPSLEIYGINMDMGSIYAKLTEQGGEYRAELVLSACVINVMRYRFEVLEEGRRTGLYIDFDLLQN